MSLNELQSMLADVKKGGSLSGGTKMKKHPVPRRKTNKTSYMEGPNAQCHGLDGVINYSRNKSIYGGQEDFQGGMADFQGGMADFQGGALTGGALTGGALPALAIPLAGAVAGPIIGSIMGKIFGSGSLTGGAMSGGDLSALKKALAGDLAPTIAKVIALTLRMVQKNRGRGGMMRGIGEEVHTGGPSSMGKHLGSSRGGQRDFSGVGGKKQKSASRSASAKAKAKTNPWLQHVASVKADNPGVPYKEILQMAKKTY